ncbi:MAG: type II toxin-antitoxin system RelE/ParE family toxin [Candidatus Aenigmarchaeota archaeon]|nr:type II toxin-antitoxin system RelE/ParE family toxin [Candidatus Aenigmarchaeota archaeon]
MAYRVIVSPTAEKDLKKFNIELQRRFFKKIKKLKDYPDIYGKPLRWPLTGRWELRFEKRWRIIYIIDESIKQVKIVSILHKDDF